MKFGRYVGRSIISIVKLTSRVQHVAERLSFFIDLFLDSFLSSCLLVFCVLCRTLLQ